MMLLKTMVSSLMEESEYIISILEKRHQTNRWLHWLQYLQEKYIQKNEQLLKENMIYYEKIEELQEGIPILEHERTLLMCCIAGYNPNTKYTACWDWNYQTLMKRRDEYNFHDKERAEYFNINFVINDSCK